MKCKISVCITLLELSHVLRSKWYRKQKKKKSKRPHIVHLSTICNLCWRTSTGGFLAFPISPRKKMVDDINIFFPLSSFVEFRSAISEEKSTNLSTQILWLTSCVSDRPKYTNLVYVDDMEILLLVNFLQIQFSSFTRENMKCENRRMNDGHRTARDHNSSLEPFVQVH